MHWKLRENIRLDKVCSTCKHGTCLTKNENIGLCFKNEEECPTKLAPRIRTCFEWIEYKD